MSNQKKTREEDVQQKSAEKSSQGNDSASVTPKDVSAKHATSRDARERKTGSANQDEKEEEMLDEAVEQSFPASDPITNATSGVTRIDVPKEK